MKQISIASIISVLLSFSANISAETTDLNIYKCGNSHIKIGMSTEQIKTQCGVSWQPTYISQHNRPALKANSAGVKPTDHFEKWMYQSAGHSATHVLIKNDEVIRIFTQTTKTAQQN